ncbi:MAG: hypothetical protein GY851_15520 [bacterium]|nr:hypothetical protein [bacterium]
MAEEKAPAKKPATRKARPVQYASPRECPFCGEIDLLRVVNTDKKSRANRTIVRFGRTWKGVGVRTIECRGMGSGRLCGKKFDQLFPLALEPERKKNP